jgi:hypothetical protein
MLKTEPGFCDPLGKAVTVTADHSLSPRLLGQLRHRKKITDRKINGKEAVSRDVLIHQTQDQGIEAIRPGAGRDDHDQHKGIKCLR